MEILNIKGNTIIQKITSILLTMIGIILIYNLIGKFENLNGNEKIGFFLGVLLLIIGGLNLILNNQQEIVINPELRKITIKNKNNFKSSEKNIHFEEITDIKIGYLGKKSNFINFYYLELTLGNGEKYPLFSPGYFYRISNREKAEEWRSKIENLINNK